MYSGYIKNEGGNVVVKDVTSLDIINSQFKIPASMRLYEIGCKEQKSGKSEGFFKAGFELWSMIFVEHVLSKHKIIALGQNIHNPITRRFFGFNVNRNTRLNIKLSENKIVSDEKLACFDVFRRFVVKNL